MPSNTRILSATILILALAGWFQRSPAQGTVTYIDAPQPFRGAQTYKDRASGVIYYVESDGRHVSAIDPDGKILWNVDPFMDAGLKPYRFPKPVIVYVGKSNIDEDSISISFDSSQFGDLDKKTGKFRFRGND